MGKRKGETGGYSAHPLNNAASPFSHEKGPGRGIAMSGPTPSNAVRLAIMSGTVELYVEELSPTERQEVTTQALELIEQLDRCE